jgi:hypothetical protein
MKNVMIIIFQNTFLNNHINSISEKDSLVLKLN